MKSFNAHRDALRPAARALWPAAQPLWRSVCRQAPGLNRFYRLGDAPGRIELARAGATIAPAGIICRILMATCLLGMLAGATLAQDANTAANAAADNNASLSNAQAPESSAESQPVAEQSADAPAGDAADDPAEQAMPAIATEQPAASEPATEVPVNEGAVNEGAVNEGAVNEGAVNEGAAADEAAGAQQAAEKAADEPAGEAAVAEAGGDPLLQRVYQRAMVIDVQGAIFGGLKSYVINRLNAAERGKYDLIVLRITSPGGELEASLELARHLSEIDWATTIAYVPDEAYSGAAIVALGCDRIFMRPRALIGDAGPIRFHGGLFEHADEKVVSALAAAIHQLAISKKRPGAVAEAMVDRKLVVYEARNKATGARTYLTAKDIEIPLNKEKYDVGAAIPESGQDRFLTVGGTRAVELMIAEGTFNAESELLAALRVEEVVQTQRTWVDRSVHILNLPLVSGLLLLIGLIGLYVEFSVPGISVAGLIAVICFGLFFWSHALGGTSGWLEVMMFALGLACLGIELFVLPGFGVFGVTGLILLVLSLVMASQDFIMPQSTVQWTTLRNNLLIVLGAMASLIIALIVQVAFFDSLPGLGSFRLEAPDAEPIPISDSVGSLTAGSTASAYLPQAGEVGISDSVLRPAGKVRFADRLVDVVTEGDFLDPGTRVEVIKREGNHVVVRRLS